jgi:alpha-galactosidase
LTLAALVMAGFVSHVAAKDIPAQLSRPDGKPGDATKPVKVYILAGQSNMVGMGELSGAKCRYNGIYLTADPAAPEGPMTIWRAGEYNILPLSVYQPNSAPADKPVAEGLLEVPQTGVYQVQCGSGESSYVKMELDGQPVYSRAAGGEPVKQDVTLKPGKRYPFKITGFKGDPPRFWMQKMDLVGHGDLETTTKRDGKFPWVVDDEGKWTVRNDVYFYDARIDFKGSPLSPTSNGKTIGPELGFGHVMGTFHDEQVLLIKTAMGNRALGYDFRPPSSGRNDPDSQWESAEYRLMVEGVRKTLDGIAKIVPDYKGQGYEIAGFVWWQGHKDSFTPELIDEYEKNLVNLINDVRKEFKAPKMPAVIATVGFGGYHMADKFQKILEAQMAVGDPAKHPEFAGTVASVDTRDFWREVDDSPTSQDYHYNRNAETYMLAGDALGRAMVKLLGGQAEVLPQAPRPKPAAQEAASEPTEQEKAAAQAALAPIILDGILPAYIANPRYNAELLREARGEKPERVSQFLQGAMYGLNNCYRAAGVNDYDWHAFGPDLRKVKWDYYSFDPKETMPKEKGSRYRKVTYPEGMENWFAPDFDAAKAGWKSGLPPFGQLGGKLEPLGQCGPESSCGCGVPPKTLWEKEVLLIRGTFDIPPLKEGCRYRIVVGGSNHVNAGEGYAIYVNGKLLAESKEGVGKRQGGQPRGGHVYADFRDEFKGGKVTIAATSFLRYNDENGTFIPRGHITLWMEEAKIPPLGK